MSGNIRLFVSAAAFALASCARPGSFAINNSMLGNSGRAGEAVVFTLQADKVNGLPLPEGTPLSLKLQSPEPGAAASCSSPDFTLSSNADGTAKATALLNNKGSGTYHLTCTYAATYYVTAVTNQNLAVGTVQVIFVPNEISRSKSLLVTYTSPAPLVGQTHSVGFIPVDSFNNGIADQANAFFSIPSPVALQNCQPATAVQVPANVRHAHPWTCSFGNSTTAGTYTVNVPRAVDGQLTLALTWVTPTAIPANSMIVGTSPVVANGVATSTITITLRDVSNSPIVGVIPTFSATGSNNAYGACSATNASGVANCTLASTTAQVKTLSIQTPIVRVGGTVTFTAGPASAATSNIVGTTPVVADGVATSTITVTLLDATSNPIVGVVPTFTATGSNNSYGPCSATNAVGIANCTLASTTAQVKTLSIQTPIVDVGSDVTFVVGLPNAGNSAITGTTPVVADGVATSAVTITLRDGANNPIPGVIPTFSATGSNNSYGACSVTNAAGQASCTLASTTAQVKTLSIQTPVVRVGGNVTFVAGSVSAANSSIAGTTPILANGVATSNITITLRDAQNNAIVGTTPTFSATGTNNIYSACSATNAAGVANCTLASTTAEVKTLSLLTPVNVTGNNITFTPGPASPLTSDITGTTPVIANGVATSAIIVTLRDVFGNPLMGTTPTFGATGTNNIYGACSATNAGGQANCTLASTTAEVKTLSIQTPIVDVGSNVTFISLTPSAANSSIVGTTPVLANGVAASAITVTLRDASNNPVPGVTPTFSATGTNNIYGACSVTDAAGVSNCSLSSTTAEVKSVSIATPVVVLGNNLTFTAGVPSAATSNITGTTPVIADGVATSIVTVTLLDAFSNPISGTVPTFSATGSNNIYGACSATNASGVATCSLASTRAQVKQLSIQTPIVDPGSNVTFTAGASSAANSSIVGTTPVLANGVATSAITITLRDAFNNPIAGLTPTFNATGSNNNYGACSATNPAGVSSCTLASITAEVKTISMTAPVAVLGNNVTFTVGAASPVTSDITGTTPVVADGVATSLITITLRDAFGNAISGVVPTFAATGFNNIYGACSATNGSGISNCTLASTRSQVKTLSIQTPIVDVGGDVTFVPGPPSAATSIIWGTTPVPANGVATSLITVALRDVFSNPISGVTPTFAATGSNNIYTACSATDILGNANCTLASTTAEVKTVSLTAPLSLVGNNVTFTVGAPSPVTSDITGTTPVLANGAATSIITITLRDAFGNAISGITPTFAATGSNNIYGACSATNSSGQSNCTLASTTAQVKTLSIQTPIVDVGGNVTFVAGTPVAGNSNIVGTSPVLANGVATSGITITLRDAFNNPVVGTVPTFAATGTNNIYGACSATDPSGTSNCTLASTTAQVKTLSIQTPIFDIGGNVTFFLPNAAPVLAFESATANMQHISGNGAVATPDVWRIPESLAGTIQLLGTDPEGYDFVAPGDFTCNASSAGGIPAWFSLTYDSPNNRIQINIAAGNSVAADKTFFIDCVVRDGVPQPSNTYFIQLTVRNNVGPIIIQPVLNLTVDEDVPLFYNLATNVSDPDTPVLNYKIFDTNNPVNPPSSDGNDTLFGEVGVMGQNGQFMYVAYKYNDINRLPNRVTTPGNPDHFTYQVDDGINPPVSGVVNITINPVNDPPVIEQLNGPHNIYDAGMVSVGGSIDVNFNVDEGIGNGAFDWSTNDYDDNEDSQTVVFSFASNNPSVVNPAQISVINFPDSPSVDARSLNPHLHIVAGGSQGVATITMTADDQQGGVTKQLFTVRVSNFVEPDVYDYCNFVFNGPPTYPPDQPPNGNGSPEKPWLVYNASQFNQLRFCGRDNHTFLLKGPIDLSGYANWIPIGSPFDTSSVGYTDQYGTTGQIRAVTRFEGEIYGDYRPITGLNINRPTTDFVGLFGIFKGKAVTIEVRDGFVVGRDHVGMFAGSITDGELRNMFITNSAPGPVTVQGHDYVGGIAGYSRARGLIADSSVSVSGASIVGGLFGALENQAIENITVSGQVVGTGSARYDFVGGVVGLSINGAMIQYAHATGRVTGNGSGVGGVVGASVESGYFHALESNATVTQTLPTAWGVGGIVGIYLGGEFSDPRAVPATAADVVTGFNAVGGVVGYHGGSSIERGIAAIPTSTSAPATAILVSGFGNTKRSSTPNCCDTGRSYWDTSINSYSQAGVPKTHAELQDPSVGSYDSSWPFFPTSIGQHAIWYKPANATSYPQLTPIPGVLAMSANITPNSAGQILNIDGVGFDIDPAYTESVRFGMSQPGTDNCIVQSVTTLSALVKRIQCLMPIFYADPSGPPPVPVGINVEVRNRTYTDPIGAFHSGLSGYNAEYTTGYPASANPSVPAWQPFPQGINAMSLFITYP